LAQCAKVLTISDTGSGMDEETQAQIFEPFFTTKEEGRGTGLGLSTVFGIVKQSGGNVWVYSEVGHGTTVRIYLPRTLETASAPRPPATEVPAGRGSETILVVEDDEGVRNLVCTVLEHHGHTVIEAAAGDEAIELSRRFPGPIHLLITDMIMPRMSGRTAADQIQAERPETRVLYVSGYTGDAMVHRGLLEPGAALLDKPFTPRSLTEKVRAVLGDG
jgi:CheY-like chemotaxis protein